MRISGGCLCGAVRFDGEAEPLFQAKCYCTDCRKTSAAGHAAMMGVPKGAISVSGEVREYRSRTDSGNEALRAFCPVCGAGVYARNSAMVQVIFVRASALDDPNCFAPQMIVYASRAPAWDPVTPGIATFSEAPPRG